MGPAQDAAPEASPSRNSTDAGVADILFLEELPESAMPRKARTRDHRERDHRTANT